ncbi:MAG: DUF4142 domain-containing protein [Kofleriaceae bacterium]|nr:DUF4142 domain-containing protein [Kofleriaceae bacterium]
MKVKTLALSAVLAVSALAYADDAKMKPEAGDKMKPGTAKLTPAEIKILAHQHMVNMMEVEMGMHAQKTAGAQVVKDYAKMLVADHQKADKDVMALAKKKGVNKMAKEPMTPEEKQVHEQSMAAMAKLKKLKGAAMDRMFLQLMVTDHARELANLDTSMAQVQDADLKMLLEQVRPVLQKHEDMARELQTMAEQTSSLESDMQKDVNKDKSKNQP